MLSARNPRVQRARRLARKRRERADERAFVLEGPNAVGAAVDAGVAIDDVFFEDGADAALLARARAAGIALHELEPGTLERVTDAVSPQPVIAVAPWCDVRLGAALADADAARPVLVLHNVRDPGNVGTLLRTAEASGVAAVVLTGDSVDLFNPKCVRASAGALFHVPVALGGDVVDVLAELRAAGRACLATDANAGRTYDEVDLTRPLAIILGNEAHGLPAEVVGAADETVAVPIEGRAESLNVAAAGAVLCFEAAHQRRRAER